MAALLGKRLGLNIPEIAVVHIDPRLGDVVSDETARETLKKHAGPHFGSRDVGPGVAIVNQGYTLMGETLEQAIDIFAFDMLIENADRSAIGVAGNPNVLFRGNDLFPIDHELAFSFVDLIGHSHEPWQLRHTELTTRHIFYARLKSYARITISHSSVSSISWLIYVSKMLKIWYKICQKNGIMTGMLTKLSSIAA
jgi:hypothetical protein